MGLFVAHRAFGSFPEMLLSRSSRRKGRGVFVDVCGNMPYNGNSGSSL
jgi:hypothetical protein